jgi:hypothetical protein
MTDEIGREQDKEAYGSEYQTFAYNSYEENQAYDYTTLMLLNTGIMHLFDNYVTSISLPWEPRFHESRGNVIRSRFIKIRLWGQGEICYVIIERVYCRVLWYGLYGLNLQLLL